MWNPRSPCLSLLYARETDQIRAHMLPTELRPFACKPVNPSDLIIEGA